MQNIKTTVNYDKLREELPNGYAIIMSEKFHCSRSKIWKVASGQRCDFRVLQALIDLAKSTKKLKEGTIRTSNKL